MNNETDLIFEEAKKLYEQKQYDKALDLLDVLVSANHVQAIELLIKHYTQNKNQIKVNDLYKILNAIQKNDNSLKVETNPFLQEIDNKQNTRDEPLKNDCPGLTNNNDRYFEKNTSSYSYKMMIKQSSNKDSIRELSFSKDKYVILYNKCLPIATIVISVFLTIYAIQDSFTFRSSLILDEEGYGFLYLESSIFALTVWLVLLAIEILIFYFVNCLIIGYLADTKASRDLLIQITNDNIK